MIIQVGNKYSINLNKVLYTEHDFDFGDRMKIVFDNGEILQLIGAKELNEFERYIKHNDMASQA